MSQCFRPPAYQRNLEFALSCFVEPKAPITCSALEALERQEPFVNQALAYQARAMLARLFRYGRLSHHGGFVNLRTGRTTSLAVDPILWRRMTTQSAESELPRRKRRRVVRP
jgi:hypothetical protein